MAKQFTIYWNSGIRELVSGYNAKEALANSEYSRVYSNPLHQISFIKLGDNVDYVAYNVESAGNNSRCNWAPNERAKAKNRLVMNKPILFYENRASLQRWTFEIPFENLAMIDFTEEESIMMNAYDNAGTSLAMMHALNIVLEHLMVNSLIQYDYDPDQDNTYRIPISPYLDGGKTDK